MGKHNPSFKSILEETARQFMAATRSEEPTNTALVESIVSKVYVTEGLAKPRIIWCNNPFEVSCMPAFVACLASQDLAALADLRHFIRQNRGEPLLARTFETLAVNCETHKLGADMPGLGSDTSCPLFSEISMLAREVSGVTAQDELELIQRELEFVNRYRRAIADSLDLLSARFREDDLRKKCMNLMRSLPADQNELLPAGLFDSNSSLSWTRDRFRSAGLIPLIGCIAKGKFKNKKVDYPKLWLTLLQEVFCIRFFENYCFVCPKPSTFKVDNESRLHNPSGAALSFKETQQLYAWHGTFLPARLILQRRSITISAIERQRNLELRRVMLDIYGLERYLRNSNARIVGADRFGILYRKRYTRGEPLQIVSVRNSTPEPDGTRKHYLLRVPPEVRTPREAVAWTFDMAGVEYDPRTET